MLNKEANLQLYKHINIYNISIRLSHNVYTDCVCQLNYVSQDLMIRMGHAEILRIFAYSLHRVLIQSHCD